MLSKKAYKKTQNDLAAEYEIVLCHLEFIYFGKLSIVENLSDAVSVCNNVIVEQ